MYKKEDLIKYDYFKDFDMDYILDSLTGVVSRGYILGFAKHLIEKNIEFAFCMIDVDNFKLVNDNYGHKIGDECLINIAESLVREVGDRGVIGRYGGDEFVIIYIGDSRYEVVHPFLGTLLGENKVARKTMCLSTVSIFVTVTIGSASFPHNASNFSDLFAKADKALYRGKIKGRNCYIVYVEELHKNIDVHRKENTFLPDMFTVIDNIAYRKSIDFNTKLRMISESLVDSFNLPDAVFWFNDLNAISDMSQSVNKIDKSLFDDIIQVLNDSDYYATSDLVELNRKSPALNKYFTENVIQSIIVVKIGFKKIEGILILYENTIVRMWQEREIAMAIYIARLITILKMLEK